MNQICAAFLMCNLNPFLVIDLRSVDQIYAEMVETVGPRRRKGEEGGTEGLKKEKKGGGGEEEKSKPFQGRYNPKLSDKNAFISHKTLGQGHHGLVYILWVLVLRSRTLLGRLWIQDTELSQLYSFPFFNTELWM